MSATGRIYLPKRVFEGVLVPPGENGRASWTLEDHADATKVTSDEDWFAWAEGKRVLITVRRLP